MRDVSIAKKLAGARCQSYQRRFSRGSASHSFKHLTRERIALPHHPRLGKLNERPIGEVHDVLGIVRRCVASSIRRVGIIAGQVGAQGTQNFFSSLRICPQSSNDQPCDCSPADYLGRGAVRTKPAVALLLFRTDSARWQQDPASSAALDCLSHGEPWPPIAFHSRAFRRDASLLQAKPRDILQEFLPRHQLNSACGGAQQLDVTGLDGPPPRPRSCPPLLCVVLQGCIVRVVVNLARVPRVLYARDAGRGGLCFQHQGFHELIALRMSGQMATLQHCPHDLRFGEAEIQGSRRQFGALGSAHN
eukprot:scaffold7029_cov375-Pinguiococcus_pyrenoidosus.AAC.29